MRVFVNISPKINGRKEFYSFCYECKSIRVQGKHLKYAAFDGKNWFYGFNLTASKPTDAVSALTATFEIVDFPASLPNELVTWWHCWKSGTMTNEEIETQLKSVEGLLETVSSPSSVAY